MGRMGRGDAPQGYANWKAYWNDVPNRREVHELVENRLLPDYDRERVDPIHSWLDMPFSERCWLRLTWWWDREVRNRWQTPWWWERFRSWWPHAWRSIRERLGLGSDELAEPAPEGGRS